MIKKRLLFIGLALSLMVNLVFAFNLWSKQKTDSINILDDFKRQLIRMRDASQKLNASEALKIEIAVMRELNGRIYDFKLTQEAEAYQEMWIAYQYQINEMDDVSLMGLSEDFNSMIAIMDSIKDVNSRKTLQSALSSVLLESHKVQMVDEVMKEHTYFRKKIK